MDVPLAADHFGHIGVNSCIRLGKALEKLQPGVARGHGAVAVHRSPQRDQRQRSHIPILTGEDIYLKETFEKLCQDHAVDIIHPDLATSGGMLETKKIGDMAQGLRRSHGNAFRRHSRILLGERALRRGDGELPRSRAPFGGCSLVGRSGGRREADLQQGFHKVPDEARTGHHAERRRDEAAPAPSDNGYFEPTPQWDKDRVNDRLWS